MKVFLAYKNNQRRSAPVTECFMRSLIKFGHRITTIPSEADMLICYGMAPSHKAYYDTFRSQGKPVVVFDLGYWMRGMGYHDDAHYKCSINHWHPTEFVLKLDMPSARFNKQNQRLLPWKDQPKNAPILLAGMGLKSYVLYKYPDQSWDIWAANEIRKHTKREVIYRPKPSWKNAPPIKGTTYSSHHQHISEVLPKCFAVVTHHSNVATDALLNGIPCFSWDGAAKNMGLDDLSCIEKPFYPENRQQYFNDLAWFNWSVAEIRSGDCWQFIKKLI